MTSNTDDDNIEIIGGRADATSRTSSTGATGSC